MKKLILLLSLFIPINSFADTVCSTRIDRTAWTHEQRSLTAAGGYEIARLHGDPRVPNRYRDMDIIQLCWDDPLFNVQREVNAVALLAIIDPWILEHERERRRFESRYNAALAELTTNYITNEWLDSVNQRISGVDTFPEVAAVLQIILRYLIASEVVVHEERN